MTRIKKRRSGKKRTHDRKKVSAGRRGGRAAIKESVEKEKKPLTEKPAPKETGPGKKIVESKKATGKTRSAGARRVAAAKSVAGVVKGKTVSKKATAVKKETTGDKKPSKGFAPWNKNKFKKRES